MTGRGLPQRDDDATSRGLVPAVVDGVHDCEDGWRLRDRLGGPLPCPICKPHLQWQVDRKTGRGRWALDRSKLPARGRERNRRTT